MITMGIELGRKTRPDLEIGICGEHGGDPSSVEFCYRVGMNYVSCSPYRIPIARLAAAQAAISGDKTEEDCVSYGCSRWPASTYLRAGAYCSFHLGGAASDVSRNMPSAIARSTAVMFS